MTPKKVMIYSRLMTGVLSYQNIVIAKDGGWHESAVTDLLRQAVNEALEEAANACIDSLTYDEDDPASTYAAIVRALKLPEEE
jgi:DNA gyrase/topoisomerase IV subunit B